ncbi:class I SAM-dependent methyltransferase [Candidatus Saccharibacteria bacterium]|nr:class I SAM-dependent methyltransferase [Candidatus Saccharibacteria bacterium]MCL1962793.1 class I SAM-dependent methyltransferase [Candidatus Saccharibacteria bacterium]
MREIFSSSGKQIYPFAKIPQGGGKFIIEVPYGKDNAQTMNYTEERGWNCRRPLFDNAARERINESHWSYNNAMYMYQEAGNHGILDEISAADVVLDFGSGAGCAIHRAVWESIQRNNKTSFIGVDIAYDQDNDIVLPQHNILQLTKTIASVPDESVDLIFACYSIFYHCEEKTLRRMIDEINRVAKRGAILRSEAIGGSGGSLCQPRTADEMLRDSGWAVKQFIVDNEPEGYVYSRFARKIGNNAVQREIEFAGGNDQRQFDHFDSLLQ